MYYIVLYCKLVWGWSELVTHFIPWEWYERENPVLLKAVSFSGWGCSHSALTVVLVCFESFVYPSTP